MCEIGARERFLYYVNYVSKQTPQQGLMNNIWSECSIRNKLYMYWIFIESCLRDKCAIAQQFCHCRMYVHLFNYKMSAILNRFGKMPELMGSIFEKVCWCTSSDDVRARVQTEIKLSLLVSCLSTTKAFAGNSSVCWRGLPNAVKSMIIWTAFMWVMKKRSYYMWFHSEIRPTPRKSCIL